VAQFFDATAGSSKEHIVALKSQLVIDILTYGLTFQSQHLAQTNNVVLGDYETQGSASNS